MIFQSHFHVMVDCFLVKFLEKFNFGIIKCSCICFNEAAFSLFTSPKFFTFLLIIYFVIVFASFKSVDATCRIFSFIQKRCDKDLGPMGYPCSSLSSMGWSLKYLLARFFFPLIASF